MVATGTTRRRILGGIAVAVVTAGCVIRSDNTGDPADSDGDGVIDANDYAPRDPDVQDREDVAQDTDGDGVVDSADYAPRDPDVQEREDVTADPGSTGTPTPTATQTDTRVEVESIEKSGSSNRGRFRVAVPSAVAVSDPIPVEGRVTEASTEQYGAFEVYVDDRLVADEGLQEGESASFSAEVGGTDEPGTRTVVVEVRFVNGDFDVDERVGRVEFDVTVADSVTR